MVELQIQNWLKPEDVGEGITVEVLDEGEMLDLKDKDNKAFTTFNISVKLENKEERVWSPNRTSQRTIGQVWGLDTKKWIGKKVALYMVKQNVKGNMKDVIYARTPK